MWLCLPLSQIDARGARSMVQVVSIRVVVIDAVAVVAVVVGAVAVGDGVVVVDATSENGTANWLLPITGSLDDGRIGTLWNYFYACST